MTESPATSTRDSRIAWTGLVLLLGLLVVLFLPGFSSPLIFDDSPTMKQIEGFDHWWQTLGPDTFGFMRPVKNLFFYLCMQLGGSLVLFHSITLAAYLLAAFGVFILARRLLDSPLWGLAAAAIWSLSAAHVTLGVWASAFNISIAAAAFGFGITSWDKWRENPSRKQSAVSFFLWLIVGLLSYETAIAIAPIAVLIDLYRGRPVFQKAALLRYTAIAVTVLSYLVARHFNQADFKDGGNPGFTADIQPWQIAVSAPYFLWTHFMMWLAPWGRIEFFGNYIWDRSIPAIILPFCWLMLIGLIVLGVRFWQPGRIAIAGAAWFLAAAFPSGNFIPFGNTPYADYYVPIPAIGLTLLTVGILRALSRHLVTHPSTNPQARFAALAVIVIIVGARGANGIAMTDWIQAWKTPAMVMAKTALARPYQYYAKATAAHMMEFMGDLETAEFYARSSMADYPEICVPYFVLGRIHFRRGEYQEAEAYFRQVLEKRAATPDLIVDTHLHLGRLIGQDPEKADEAFKHYFVILSESHDYQHIPAILESADLYRRAERPVDQIKILERGLHYYPDNELIRKAFDEAKAAAAAEKP
ncbi:MAG: tetratricopeptide repeat protein [Akkermansiaceae bacterium]|jgi:hypothetical protein|nr:tetratricopeptide repeat protein [Akkermansiaceae bacterium]